MKTFKLNVTSSQPLTESEFLKEVLLAETKANGTSLLRFHVEEMKSPFKLTSEIGPPHHVELIGYNKEWVDEDYNPDGTCICFLDDVAEWYIAKWCGACDEWHTRGSGREEKEFSRPLNPPTHWTEKPKFN